MNNKIQNIFLQLLQVGLWQKTLHKFTTSISPEEWAEIYSYATIHTVEGVIFDSFPLLLDYQLPPQSLRIKWAVRIDQIERHNDKMNVIISTQFNSFTNLGLIPILQKGQGVANCYINPNHRVCGDIDWYFENNGYAKAREFLKKENMPFNDTAGFSLEYNFNGIPIEHHKHLFDLRNPLKSNYLKAIQKKYSNKKQIVNINNTPVEILSPELHILQVNVHILKHMISFGIGMRQICDAARLYTYYKESLNNDLLKDMYKKTGIIKWIHVLHHLLETQIGLNKLDLPFSYPLNTNSDWMLAEIWHGGNFGYHDRRFADGKIIRTISVHPDGARRLWNNFQRYFPFAPQEAIFFPIMKLYSRYIGIDRD